MCDLACIHAFMMMINQWRLLQAGHQTLEITMIKLLLFGYTDGSGQPQ